MIGQIVTATKTHALMMAPHVRAAEVREVLDSYGMTPVRALLHELERSVSAWSWIVDDEVACMFGIVTSASLLDYSSYPWMLTTPLVEQHAFSFARACRSLLPEVLARHPKLTGMVDARYQMSVRWLRWLGAHLCEPQPWGAAGSLFHPFLIGESRAEF